VAADRAQDKSLDNANSAALRAVERDREQDWHRWRRRERRLSQQCRALKAIPLDRDHERHKNFAEKLGEAQDFSLLIAHCGPDSPFSRDDRRALRELAIERLLHLRAKLIEGRTPKVGS